MKILSRVIATLGVLGALGYAGIAQAQSAGLEPKHLGGNLRYQVDRFPAYIINTATVAETAGRRGAVLSLALSSATSFSSTTLGMMPYPAVIRYVILESGDDTATCSSLVIQGYGIDGRLITDTQTNLSETAAYGEKVFSQVVSVAASGCSAGLDASDTLTLVTSVRAGLTYPIRAASQADAICAIRGTDAIPAYPHCNALSVCTTNLTGNLYTSYVDLSTCAFTGLGAAGALIAGDSVTLRYRASTW